MKPFVRTGPILLALFCAEAAVTGCSSGPIADEEMDEIGRVSLEARKCVSGIVGQADYCWAATDPACLCTAGEGDCDSNSHCALGLVCGRSKGTQFGYSGDACVMPHCVDRVLNADEVTVDCGGLDCGWRCPEPCESQPPNGDASHCSDACPCPIGGVDCDSDSQCQPGLVCVRGLGSQFGFVGDACASPHCMNGVMDGGETQIDCGGPDCGTWCSEPCSNLPPNGSPGHCTTECLCSHGEGDCNTEAECEGGLVCAQNVGAEFGFDAGVDVCVGGTCTNAIEDGTELGTDCGPECAACGAYVSSADYGGGGYDTPNAVAYASDGSYVVAGRFTGTSDFGCGALSAIGTTSDVFVVKYSRLGVCQWSHRFGGPGADGDIGVSVAVDPGSNVIVVGNFSHTADFLGTALTAFDASQDIFAAKLNRLGSLQWARRFGGAGIDRARGVATDSSGRIYVGGGFSSTMSLCGTILAAEGAMDALVMRLDASGNCRYARSFGGALSDDVVYGVTSDADGVVTAVGTFRGTVDFGTGGITTMGLGDVFVLRLDSGGATQWVRTYGSTRDEFGLAVTQDGAGQPVVAGTFKGDIDFGGGALQRSGAIDGFVLGLTAAGGYRWAHAMGATMSNQAIAVTADSIGNTAVLGYFQGTIDLGAGARASAGNDDVYIVRYSPAGTALWSRTAGGVGTDYGQGIANWQGRLTVVGRFDGSLSLGGSAHTGTLDAFVATYRF